MLQRLKSLFSPKTSLNAGDFWRSDLGKAVLKEKHALQLMKKQIQIATESDTFKQGVPKTRNEHAYAHAYETTLWVHVAIKAIAQSAAMLPIKVMESSIAADGTVTTEEITDPDVFAVQALNSPNPFDTPYEFKLNIFGSYGYSGNSFIYVDPDEVEMWNLKPQEVHVVASKSNFIDGYMFKRTGSAREVFLPPERVIHTKSFHPTSYFYGLSPLSAAWDSVSFLNFDDAYWHTFFKEGGRVMGVWSMDGSLSDDEYARLKEEVKNQYKGSKNMFKDIVVDGGLKFSQLGISAKDQNLIEKNKLTREEVLAAYSVPPSIAGLLDFANYSNMEVQERLFYQQGIQPILRLLEEALSKNPILSENGRYHFEFDTSDVSVLQANQVEQANLGKILIESSQMTPNEVRERFWELPPLDGGAALKPIAAPAGFGSPLTLQLGSPHSPKEVEGKVKELPAFNHIERPETPHFTDSDRERMAKQFEEDLDKSEGDINKTSIAHFENQQNLVLDNLRTLARNTGKASLEAEDIPALLAGFAGVSRQYQQDLNVDIAAVMKKFGDREAGRVDMAVRKQVQGLTTKAMETVIQTVILSKDVFPLKSNADEWVQTNRFRSDNLDETNDTWRFRQLDPEMIEEGSFRTIMLADGVTAVIGRLIELSSRESKELKNLKRTVKQDENIVFDFSDPRVAEFAQRRASAVALEVDTGTQEELRQVLAQSIREGKSTSEIADDIEGFFTTQTAVRAARIARTETAVAANRSIMLTYEQNSDVVDGKVWITARDSSVRQDHRDLDGSFRTLDEGWVLGGAVAPHPGAFGLADQDINCRCTIRAEVRV